MKTLEDVVCVPVRFSEIDSMGIVWHGSYVAYLEDGRESFGRHFPGIGYADMQRAGIYAPVYDMHIRYLASLKMNDVAEIHTQYEYHPGARLDYIYKIYNHRDGSLCIEAKTTQLFIDGTGQMVDTPDYYREWQEKYLEMNE